MAPLSAAGKGSYLRPKPVPWLRPKQQQNTANILLISRTLLRF